MNVKSPSICLGAIEAIEFLLNSYNDVLEKNPSNKEVLEKAKTEFLREYEKIKQKKENKELSFQNHTLAFKHFLIAYGKIYISKDINNDPVTQQALAKTNEQISFAGINYSDPEELKYDYGYLCALKLAKRNLLDALKIYKQNLAKELSQRQLSTEMKQIRDRVLPPLNEEIKRLSDDIFGNNPNHNLPIGIESRSYLLGMKDAFEYCNNNYLRFTYGEIDDFGTEDVIKLLDNQSSLMPR